MAAHTDGLAIDERYRPHGRPDRRRSRSNSTLSAARRWTAASSSAMPAIPTLVPGVPKAEPGHGADSSQVVVGRRQAQIDAG